MPWEQRDNPFQSAGQWFKGALHTHTTESDGKTSPSDLARAYRELGFHFLVFTDHGKVTTLNEPSDDFLTLGGIEIGLATGDPDKYWHLIGVGTDGVTRADFDSPVRMHEYLRSRAAFCILAHPYWSQLTGKDLTLLEGLASVEVWNTGCELEIGRGFAEYQWDYCLSAGRRTTGVAVDDCHSRRDVGAGWVMVKAAELSADAITDALSRGRFYSSCGPEIHDVRLLEDGLEVITSPCRVISFIADAQKGARVLGETDSEITSAAYLFRGGERYVRVACVDAHRRKAWSNPFYPAWPAAPGESGTA